jgi:protein phosphatase
VEKYVEADIFQLDVAAEDTLLLCSDGLSDMLRDTEMEKLLHINGGLAGQERCPAGTGALKRRPDNISFIIIGLNDSREVD